MEKQGWKRIALVSILFLTCILIINIWSFQYRKEYEIKKEICAFDICGLKEGEHDSFFYTDIDDTCWCFKKGTLDKIEYVNNFLEKEVKE